MMHSSPDQVADVSQEIWVAIFRALPGLREADRFRPWAFRTARRPSPPRTWNSSTTVSTRFPRSTGRPCCCDFLRT
jgi:hypothetical protein